MKQKTCWKVDGDKLSGLILTNELTPQDVANKLGTSYDRVFSWIREEEVPTLAEVDALEEEYQWELRWYMGEATA